MNKFLTIAMLLVIISLLSCGSGIISVLAAAILPFFTILGVGLMALNVLVANGQNNNALPGQNDPAAVLGQFMDLLLFYSSKIASGLFFGIGKMIGWGMPAGIVGPEPVPVVPVRAPDVAQEVRSKKRVKITLHICCRHCKKEGAARPGPSVSPVYSSHRSKVSVS